MREFTVSFRDRLKTIDKTVVFCVLGMIILSVLTIFGGYAAGGYVKFTASRVITQAFTAALGIAVMLVMSFMDYDHFIKRLDKAIFVFMLCLLVILIIFGEGDHGNKNWLYINFLPFNIQPTEFCKPLFIITFSRHIDSLKRNINHPLSLLQLMLHAGIILGLLAFTKDLGTILVYCFIIFFMLFTAGLSIWYFIALAAVVVLAFPFLWEHMADYQQKRIICGFNPELDPIKYGYQALKSRDAVAAGRLFGSGIVGGHSYKLIPEAQSDFLFAVLAEKFGMFGCLFYIILMTVLILRILYISRKARKDYAANICVGIAAMFIVQSVENIGMCLAFMPVIGITLPFFSYGGSSLLASAFSVGLVLSIYSHKKKYYFEREEA